MTMGQREDLAWDHTPAVVDGRRAAHGARGELVLHNSLLAAGATLANPDYIKEES